MRTSFLLIGLLLADRLAAAETRIAVVESGGSGGADAVVDLVVAALSTRDELVVLERQQISELLKEQELSLAGVVDAARIVQLGRILTVDVFVCVEQSADTKRSQACVVYDAATGIRLCDRLLNSDALESTVRDVVSCVDAAAKKRLLRHDQLKTLSIVGVRNADMPRSQDTQCQSLAIILERKLTRLENTALLERTRLAWLQQEQNLTGGEREKQLLSSILQVDLEFSKHADGIRAMLVVHDAAGKEVHQVISVAKQLDASVVADLVQDLARYLNSAQLPKRTNGRHESERYFREARLQMSFGETQNAVHSAEAALLLDPNDSNKELLLAEYLFKYGRESCRAVAWPYRRDTAISGSVDLINNTRRIAALGERGIDLLNSHFRQLAPTSPEQLDDYRKRTVSAHAAYRSLFQLLPHFDSLREERAEIRRKLMERAIQMSRDRLDLWRDFVDADPGAATAYSHGVGQEILTLWMVARGSVAVTDATIEFVNDWLDVFDRLPAARRPHEAIRGALAKITGARDTGREFASRMASLTDRLIHHPNMVIQVYGRRGRLFMTLVDRDTIRRDGVRQFQPIRETVTQYLAQPSEPSNIPIRRALYGFLQETYSYIRPNEATAESVNEHRKICESMLARKELHVRLLCGQGHIEDQESAAVQLKLIDRAVELCRSPQFRSMDTCDRQTAKSLLEKSQFELHARWPALSTNNGNWQVQTKLLYELPPRHWNRNILCHPLVLGDNVYVVVQSESQKRRTPDIQQLKIASLPLGGGPPKFSNRLDIESRVTSSAALTRVVTGSCLHEGKICVATRTGIAEFDLQSGEARILPVTSSFPTKIVQSVASFDGRLFAGLEGGYLVSFAADDTECQINVSSRRKDVQSPLDDRRAFDLFDVISDPVRDRLLLQLTAGSFAKGGAELWEFRPRTGKFSRLLDFNRQSDSVSNIHQGRMIISGGAWFVLLDLATDQPFTVSRFSLGPKLNPQQPNSGQVNVFRPVLSAGRIWSPSLQTLVGRLETVSVKGNDQQLLAVDLPEMSRFEIFAGWYVAPVDENRFLWSNHHRLWLVTPQPPEAIPSAESK